jgi:ABC-type Fe3+ transport system substrate-binding protein
MQRNLWVLLALLGLVIFPADKLWSAAWESEWKTTIEAAKQEGKIVVGTPARGELRKELQAIFEPQFGIKMELFPARGPSNASRIASEFKAGVRYFDVYIGGSGTYDAFPYDGIAEEFMPYVILPEVKDAKHWWGGHIWEDNIRTNRFLYSFIADAGTGSLWYNSDLVKAEAFRSLDDFLNPKWKGKIALLDPRTPGSGQSLWSFFWDIKGEEYLNKLMKQDLFISRDQRQIGAALAKGTLAIGIGISFYTLDPFIKSGLPVKQLPPLSEGLPTSNGSGVIGIVKNPPHPNATKAFINWFLGKEGQTLYTKVMQQGTRRLDVDTKWLASVGREAAKDVLTIEEYHKLRNHLEDKYKGVRIPAAKFAEKILK